MSWFDELIQARKEQDENRLEESFIQVASSVLGKKATHALENEMLLAKGAVDEILKYYHFKPVSIPDYVKDAEDSIEYCLRPYGMMRRQVSLDKKWYRTAFGPMLGRLVEDDTPVALIPGRFFGYTYIDPRDGKRVRVNAKTAALIKPDAVCFYRPLPMTKLSIMNLITYMIGCLNLLDVVRIIAVAVSFSIVGLAIPALTKAAVGSVAIVGNGQLLIATAISLAMIRLSQSFLEMTKNLVIERMKIGTSLMVEAAVMTRLLMVNVRFFRKYSSGEMASRAVSIQEICDILIDEVFGMGLLSLSSMIYIVQIVHYGPALAWPSLLAVVLTFITMIIGACLRMRLNRKHMHHEALEKGMKYALITGIRKIRLAGAEDRAFARWASMYAEGAKLVYNPPFFLKIESVIQKAIQLFAVFFIYLMTIKAGVALDDYYAFNAAFGIIMGAFVTLGTSVDELAKIRPAMRMAEPILNEEPERSAEKKDVVRLRGDVSFAHVDFRYDDSSPYVLKDLSLSINAGEYVALVGKTGCGKSTFVRLMLGFEMAERGAIYYGRQEIKRMDLKSLRSKIGVVMQNSDLIPGSIYDNISLISPGLPTEEAWKAARIAGIEEDIRRMPMGMHTVISEGQGSISGGQKQRLLIARAIAGQPSMLIFDEATSALDNRTQKMVTEALDGLSCTRIVIAHRLSTIRCCDRIFVMDEGKIAESGTYEELMEKQGLFYELTSKQQL